MQSNRTNNKHSVPTDGQSENCGGYGQLANVVGDRGKMTYSVQLNFHAEV